GEARSVITSYLTHGVPNKDRLIQMSAFSGPYVVGGDLLRLESLEWLCDLPLQHGQRVAARILFRVLAPIFDLAVGIGFSTLDGKRLLTYETDFQQNFRPSIPRPGLYEVEVEIHSLPLAPDIYALDIGCRSGDFH